tara:strand:+ start:243 stop:455 length:213 start_codon:yes stop_codon:yes gene_type:complete
VVESSDPTLVGRRGVVLDESRNTIMIQESDKVTTLAKDVIRFTIDGSEPVVGSMVCQRPEDRVQRKYRRN